MLLLVGVQLLDPVLLRLRAPRPANHARGELRRIVLYGYMQVDVNPKRKIPGQREKPRNSSTNCKMYQSTEEDGTEGASESWSRSQDEDVMSLRILRILLAENCEIACCKKARPLWLLLLAPDSGPISATSGSPSRLSHQAQIASLQTRSNSIFAPLLRRSDVHTSYILSPNLPCVRNIRRRYHAAAFVGLLSAGERRRKLETSREGIDRSLPLSRVAATSTLNPLIPTRLLLASL